MQKITTVKLPIANILSIASRGLAVTAISGYQKFISPHKGFACAHRVLYGCESCSQYFKQVIAEEGIFVAIANAKGRFQECREANKIIKNRRAKSKSRREYYASRAIANTASIESGDPENPDFPDLADSPEETDNSGKERLGGSQWQRKLRSQTNNGDGGANNNCNSCDNCADCASCGDGLNAIPSDCISDRHCQNPFESMDCSHLSCHDLNCDNADCLSGMDCSGLDCSGLDCSGLDCSGLDCGGCG